MFGRGKIKDRGKKSDKSLVKVLILLLLFISCSSKHGVGTSDQPELEIVGNQSIDKLFEYHQVGVVKKRTSRNPASTNSLTNLNDFRDSLGKLTKKIGNYSVKSNNETLMLIAFNLYGEFSYWKSLAKLNKDFLYPPYKLKKGVQLKYFIPRRDFVYRPDGMPFLINKGHTLSKISDIVYENWRRWPEIYDNNKPLIKNPNKIYAGFTLYYLDEDDLSFPKRLSRKSHKGNYSSNPLLKKMLKNINKANQKSRYSKVSGNTPSWSLGMLKTKLKNGRKPSSEEKNQSVAKRKLTSKETKAINKIKQAVKVDQQRIKKEKSDSSLLDKVKNSFKQFDYY